MSIPEETAEEVTEDEFVEAFLNLLLGTIRFALEHRHLELYTVAIERRDDEMFSLLEGLELSQAQDFARKALAHQHATGSRGKLYQAAVQAAVVGEQLADICEDLAKVKHYCAQAGIVSTSVKMEDIMRQAGS